MNIGIIRTTNLDNPILPEALAGALYMNENQAHRFAISCTKGNAPVTLAGSVSGRFIRPDGQTVLLTGSITEGVAYVTLPQSCYIVPGRFVLALFNVDGGATTTIYAAMGNVARTQTGSIIDPGNVIPDIDDLLAEIENMRTATAAAEAAASKAVRYDSAQTLTDAQKATARGNIGAASTGDVDDLKSALRKKAPIQIISTDNILFSSDRVDGYYYTGSKVANSNYCYFPIEVEGGVEYTEVGARFIYTQGGTAIINDSGPGTVKTFTPNSTRTLYASFQYDKLPTAVIVKSTDYRSDVSRYEAPNFNPNVLAQVDGESTYKAASQKLVHDIAEEIEANSINERTEDGRLSPLAIRGITYEEGSSIVLPPWTVGKYAWNDVGNKIAISTNENSAYVVINVSEGTIYFNSTPRFACVCNSNGTVLAAYNRNGAAAIYEISIPANESLLYITLDKTVTSAFICSSSSSSNSSPSLQATFDMHFPNYDYDFDTLIQKEINKFTKARFRESACRVGSTWQTTAAYANFDTYWFLAKAGVTYIFGCNTRFFNVDNTLVYSSGTYAGFAYTPESNCVIWCSISKTEATPIVCVEAPHTVSEANPVGVATLNPSLIAHETGNSPILLMSQKAITEALAQGNPTIQNKIYGKGFYALTGNLSDGDSFNAPITNVKKNNVYSFVCKIISFSSLLIGHGKTAYDSNYFEITGSKVILHTYYTSDSTREFTHGITISDYLYIQIQVGNGEAKIQMYSNGQSFSQDGLAWSGDGNARSFVESVGSELTDCEFTWSSGDFRKSVWAFGDSYFGFTGNSRWPYYLAQNGYLDNVLLNAYPGENTTSARTSLQNMIANFGCPNFIVWCLGMNDGSDTDASTPSSSWMAGVNAVIALCEENGITPIFATIPSVPGRTGVSPIYHEGKNNWVRNSGYRYIDFAKAVGATWNAENTTWYSGMISSDGIHPDIPGAIALYYRAIADVPEFTYKNP